jgi:redox-sensitive bicupin YhaK (pirin superfamily)
MRKKVKFLIPAYDVNMGGILLKQALPTIKVDQVDPFLLLHHGKFTSRADAPAKQQGIGPHPHRGFSPVTFVVEGEVQHRDSWGNNQIAKKGEVQWMHAGAGIIHSERPSQALAEVNGSQEIIQLWINSPAHKKMTPPKYFHLEETQIPVFLSEDKAIRHKVIAGNYQELRGKINTESEVLVIWSESLNDGSQTFSIPEKYNAMIYVIKGEIKVSGYGLVDKECLLVFENEGTDIELSAKPDTQFLVLAGIPLNEKIAQQGPFVMNNATEIMEAMRDYQMGKMGMLIEE